MSYIHINTDWSKLSELGENCPDISSVYFKQQEFLSNLTKYLSSIPPADLGLGMGTQQAVVQNVEKKEAKPEEKKEVK